MAALSAHASLSPPRFAQAYGRKPEHADWPWTLCQRLSLCAYCSTNVSWFQAHPSPLGRWCWGATFADTFLSLVGSLSGSTNTGRPAGEGRGNCVSSLLLAPRRSSLIASSRGTAGQPSAQWLVDSLDRGLGLQTCHSSVYSLRKCFRSVVYYTPLELTHL